MNTGLKLTLIECGGTISSALSKKDGIFNVGKIKIAEFFSDISFYKQLTPFTVFSENIELSQIELLAKIIRAETEVDECDGIIVTFGTDTLSFTGSILSLMLYDIAKPVVIVSANYPPDNKKSNAKSNMETAVKFIDRAKNNSIGGVYISYKNNGEKAKIHYAARVLPMRTGEDYLQSAGKDKGIKTTSCALNFNINLTLESSFNKKRVILINPYVGLDYILLAETLKNSPETEIVFDAYHSGTIKTNGENSINAIKNNPVFLAGKNGDAYESLLLINNGINIYNNITAFSLYAKLLLSRNFDEEKRKKYLITNTANEYYK